MALGGRPLGKFLSCIQHEYGPTQEVERIEKLQLVMGFNRKPDWSVRVFWQKYRRAGLYANQTGIALPIDLEFDPVLHALMLSPQHRQMLISHFEPNRI